MQMGPLKPTPIIVPELASTRFCPKDAYFLHSRYHGATRTWQRGPHASSIMSGR